MAEPEITLEELKAADSHYRPFPEFAQWAMTRVDERRWASEAERLATVDASPEVHRRAKEAVKRAAAIETGAIEKLYELEQGFTFTVAFELAGAPQALEAADRRTQAILKSQLETYGKLIDLATGAVPLSQAYIREIHANLCAPQGTHTVYTAIGPQERELPLGQYKTEPNHVMTRSGEMHAYCPVGDTPAEMGRLFRELETEAFLTSHPVQQASYAHYCLVAIHPFADGNGRVARALASVYFARAESLPYLVFATQKSIYLRALAAADKGHYQDFVDFTFDRGLEAFMFAASAISAAKAGSIEDTVGSLSRLYVTRGGWTHKEVDLRATALIQSFHNELKDLLTKSVPLTVAAHDQSFLRSPLGGTPDGFRTLITEGPLTLELRMSTHPPAVAKLINRFTVEVPKDASVDDFVVIRKEHGPEILRTRLIDLDPEIGPVTMITVRLGAERVIADALVWLNNEATTALRSSGYA